MAHLSHIGDALSLIAIRIATGRRHQIRSHFSHVGYPTVCDGMYTVYNTFRSDFVICPQNFLHRYRLAFRDAASVGCEVMQPLPADLLRTLRQLTAKDKES